MRLYEHLKQHMEREGWVTVSEDLLSSLELAVMNVWLGHRSRRVSMPGGNAVAASEIVKAYNLGQFVKEGE